MNVAKMGIEYRREWRVDVGDDGVVRLRSSNDVSSIGGIINDSISGTMDTGIIVITVTSLTTPTTPTIIPQTQYTHPTQTYTTLVHIPQTIPHTTSTIPY